MANYSELHLKYRPKEFDDFLGQGHIAKSIQKQLDDGSSRTFLFTGSAGCGKTSMGRAIAGYVGADASNIIEIDAATYTGIDAIRQITEKLHFRTLGGPRIVIVDECHQLSTSAMQSLLKWIEEPPPEVFWVLCTTEEQKVPKTIKTRCAHYHLKPLDSETLFELLSTVSELEGISVEESGLDLIAEEADGSPRQALVFLSQCRTCKTRNDVREMIRSSDIQGDAMIDFCRWLVSGQGRTWKKAIQMVEPLKDMNPESVRLVVLRYLSKTLLGTKDQNRAAEILFLVEVFTNGTPNGYYNQSEGVSPLLLALGKIVLD